MDEGDVDIEQLLAMEDSEDEIDADGVDVNQLLEEDDEDDEIFIPKPTAQPPPNLIRPVAVPAASTPSPAASAASVTTATTAAAAGPAAGGPAAGATGSSVGAANMAVLTPATASAHRPLSIQVTGTPQSAGATQAPPLTSPSPGVTSVSTSRPSIQARFSDSMDSVSSFSSTGGLFSPPSRIMHARSLDSKRAADALEIAEHRERRFLEGGRREVISALQVKLSKLRESNSSAVGMTRVHATRLSTISSHLARHVQLRGAGGGAATCICVHPKFIAVGNSRGLVLLFDHFQELRQVIGTASNAAGAKVTSICVSTSADMLLSGYEDGKIVLWDVLKGTALRQTTDIHSHPITAIRCLPSSATSPTEFTAISTDAKGVMYRLRFYRSLLSGYVVDSECLLDGQGGDVLCMEPLAKPPEKTVFANMAAQALAAPDTHAVAFSSSKRSFLVQVYPSVNILHRWYPPEGVTPSGEFGKPRVSLAWQWVTAPGNLHAHGDGTAPMTVAVLRAWETVLELFMLTSETNDSAEKAAFRLVHTMRVQSPILATKWLGADKAVLLTEGDVIFVRTDTLVPLEHIQLDSAHLSPAVLKGISEAVSMCDEKFYLLLQEQAYMFGLQSWFEQVDDLVKDGQWLDALALVLDQQRNVDMSGGYSQPAASRKAQELSDKADSYLLKYVTLSMDNAPRLPPSSTHGVSTSSRSHYHMMAGVCIEYCLEAMRTDLLFGDVYTIFKERNQSTAFLETLEPYILNIKIESIPPVVLADLVSMFKDRGDLSGLERCLVHLNPREMDLHTLLMFTASSGMMLAILYIYSQGLRDYAGAFQVVAEAIFLAMPHPIQPNSFLSIHQVAKVNSERLLLFVFDTFSGRMFPRRLPSAAAQEGARGLLQLVLAKRHEPPVNAFWRKDAEDQKRADEHLASMKGIQFPYLLLLAGIDVRGFFRCMQTAINKKYALQPPRAGDADEAPSPPEAPSSPSASSSSSSSSSFRAPPQTVGSLLRNLYNFCKYAESRQLEQPLGLRVQMLTVLQDEIVECDENVPKSLVRDLVDFMIQKPDAARDRHVHDQVTKLARKHSDIFDQRLRDDLQKLGFWRALLTLVKSRTHIDNVSEFKQALLCYFNEHDPEFQLSVFTFIDEVLSFFGASTVAEDDAQSKSTNEDIMSRAQLTRRRDVQEHELKIAVIDHIVDLWNIDRERTKALTVTHFRQLYEQIVKRTTHYQSIQFQLLEVLVTGHNWKPPSSSSSSSSVEHDEHAGKQAGRGEGESKATAEAEAEAAALVEGKVQKPVQLDPHTELLYVTLLATYKPGQVYEYLCTHPIRSAQEMLLLCRQKKLVDAIAYLLEQSGDVQGALSTVLHEITTRLAGLRRALDRFVDSNGTEALTLHPSASRASYRGPSGIDALDQMQEWAKVKRAIDNAVCLCQRHDAGDKERAEALWFDVLDTLLKERTKILDKGRVADAMATAIGRLVKQLVEPMSRSVGPQEIVKRIIDGVASTGSRLAEFKEVMFSMLDTYSYQMALFETVNKLLSKDSHQTYEEKLKLMRGGVRVTAIGQHSLPAEATSDRSKAPDLFGETMENALFDVQVHGSAGTAVQKGQALEEIELGEEFKQEHRPKRRVRAHYRGGVDLSTFSQITADTTSGLVLSPPERFEYEEHEPRRPGSMPVHARFLRAYSGEDLS